MTWTATPELQQAQLDATLSKVYRGADFKRPQELTDRLKSQLERSYPRGEMLTSGALQGITPGALLGGGLGALIQAIRRENQPDDTPHDKRHALSTGLGWGALLGGGLGAGLGASQLNNQRNEIEKQLLAATA